MRWDVETKPNVFEDVGADRLEVLPGTLVFTDEDHHVLFAYAPGTWLTVSLGES